MNENLYGKNDKKIEFIILKIKNKGKLGRERSINFHSCVDMVKS